MNRLIATALVLGMGFASLGVAVTPAFAAQKPGPQNCANMKDSKAKQECVQKAAKAKHARDKHAKAAAPAKK
ncbi:MAG: hypothetical protein EXQ90_09210 [Rhodospirillales bacterium]|nr:hypothetical protein [Rhodospirillales bacterium]